MIMRRTVILTGVLLAAAVCLLGGCTQSFHSFPDHNREEVWAALVAVAQSPTYYDDWTVRENEVAVFEADRRIEIYRELHRSLHLPRQDARLEERAYRFQIRFLDRQPPQVKFINRDPQSVAYTPHETERYFNAVHELLGDEVNPQPQPELEEPDRQPAIYD